MKSKRKAWKILNTAKLVQEIKDKDLYIDSISKALDRAHDRINRESKHMLDLANFLQMDNIENLSMKDVVNEIKKRIG